jgi:hypothetical protein
MRKLLKYCLGLFGLQAMPVGTLPLSWRWMTKLVYLAEMYKKVETIEGSVVECGVGKGRTFLMFAHLIQGKRQLWGFDSFEGFPESSAEDVSSQDAAKGTWTDTSVKLIYKILSVAGIHDVRNIHLVKGFFKNSLVHYDGKPIALLHIDVDLYQSYVDVLETMIPFVAKDGYVLLDDYGEVKWPGATLAVDEFVEKNGYHLQKHPCGKYFFQV